MVLNAAILADILVGPAGTQFMGFIKVHESISMPVTLLIACMSAAAVGIVP